MPPESIAKSHRNSPASLRISADRAPREQSVIEQFTALDYVCSKETATAVFLMVHLQRPLLVEGPPGVGKTELAKVLAQATEAQLIRLQCYEGLDEAKALYEWEYAKQLLYTQILKDKLGELMAGAATVTEAADRIAARSRREDRRRGISRVCGPRARGRVVHERDDGQRFAAVQHFSWPGVERSGIAFERSQVEQIAFECPRSCAVGRDFTVRNYQHLRANLGGREA